MVKDEPVSLMRQTIYAIIPILDIYASYRVKRLRKYLLIMILVSIGIGIAHYAAFPSMTVNQFSDEMQPLWFDMSFMAVWLAETISSILLAVYLIRHWSKQWNKKFESSTEST